MKQPIKDRIVLTALMEAPHAGWDMDALRAAAEACGEKPRMADALFSNIDGATSHVSAVFDRMMMENLTAIDAGQMKVRERIATAVRTRLDLMAPYRDGLRVALSHWARPLRAVRAGGTVWRSADAIWQWAGDTATDYNRYTKRGLLSGVMASTLLFWLQDNSPGCVATRGFLDRRIENVLGIGKVLGRIKARRAA